MSWIRRALLWIGVLLVLLVIAAYLLPRQVHVDRSIVINAPRGAVFAQINGFQTFNKWSPWFELDPNAKYTFEGPATGVGSKMSWVGDPSALGSGSQVITAVQADERVASDVDFGQGGIAKQVISLAGNGAGTKVTWGIDIDLGMNPVSRYFGLAMDGMVGRDFEKGLGNLKKVVEASK
jgi:Polyketide cyclase / dehydrase and lipid transport